MKCIGGIRKREGFTATELLGCLRKVRLEQEHDCYLDPEELYWAFRGQLMHEVAKQWVRRGDEDAIAEQRFAAKVFLDAEPLSGQPDLVYCDRGHILDFETTKRLLREWLTCRCKKFGEVMHSSEFVSRKNVKSYACPHCQHEHDYAAQQAGLTKSAPRARQSHVGQINVYAWILAQHDVAIRTGEIIYLDMGGMIRPPVEIWPMTRTAELIEGAYNALLANALPEPITEPEEQWQCNYYPVRRICEGQETSLTKAA